ncbi:Protein of unknown function [Pyronema omphalodes CBS 100304]|uniref:Uncharacterized protein n=1 Tax=Pyronema omphalodes (strain CBS 100304) TaxID=1076935 RepID=U4LM76_PYROM|nr:Protein of unknown function [Pyronema omphalodes CBS 100304]
MIKMREVPMNKKMKSRPYIIYTRSLAKSRTNNQQEGVGSLNR